MKKLQYILLTLCLLAFVVPAISQVQSLKSDYTLTSDTVVNAGTSYLTSPLIKSDGNVSVQVVCTKISGTVAGTISLLGSIDGTNYKALTVEEASTAVNTYTATDVASQNFIWRIKGNPVQYYRVSWTGTGTMSASFSSKILSRQ